MGVDLVVAVAAAAAVGTAVAWWLGRRQRAETAVVLEELRRETERAREASLGGAVDTVVTVAREQLSKEAEAGRRHLDTRNELMDERIDGMQQQLEKVRGLVEQLEQARERRYGELTEQLTKTGQTTAELARTAQSLREALAKPQTRGQWGERMAEDVLRTAGFVEGVNYRRQHTTEQGRPDFTFLLPGERQLHMDVKFPLDNYLRFLEAEAESDRESARKAFLSDVRRRLRDLSRRGYDEPSDGTLDYVLLFIPNEHVYGFLHEQDPDLLDESLRRRIILCSPLTLFAVLGVVRQAVDNFAFEATSHEILELLGDFRVQWDKFADAMDKVGDRLQSTRRAYDDVMGVRRRQLERQLDRVDDLRSERAKVAALDERRAPDAEAIGPVDDLDQAAGA